MDGDPWDKIEEKYKAGQVLTAKVSRLVEFGVFVELEKNVEGLIHKTEISNPAPKSLEEAFKPGDEVTFKVIGVDSGKRRISLSVKALASKGSEAEVLDDEQIMHRKTSAFQKMLKKFMKTAKAADSEDDEDFE